MRRPRRLHHHHRCLHRRTRSALGWRPDIPPDGFGCST